MERLWQETLRIPRVAMEYISVHPVFFPSAYRNDKIISTKIHNSAKYVDLCSLAYFKLYYPLKSDISYLCASVGTMYEK